MGNYKRVISRVTIFIIHIRGLITPLITTHEPPRKPIFRVVDRVEVPPEDGRDATTEEAQGNLRV